MKKFTLPFIFVFLLFCSFSASAQLVINEVDYDQAGTDSSEFIEIYNSSANAVNLGTYAVVLVNGFNDTPYDTIMLPAQMLNPSAFFVICGNGGTVLNCNMVLPAASNIIQNGYPDAIALYDTTAWTVVDAVSYEGDCGAPYIEGTGVPGAQSDSSIYNYYGISRFPDGTDLNDNSLDFHGYCITPGTANTNTTTGCTQPVAVKNILKGNYFSLYPNPASSYVNIESSSYKVLSVSVKNILGREVKKASSSNGKIYMDINSLDAGVYMVYLRTEAGISTQRFIIR